MFASLKKQPFIKMAQLSTLIAEGVEITGNLLFTNGMRIDSRIKGDVTSRISDKAPSLLVLSARGVIEGVRCGDAVISNTSRRPRRRASTRAAVGCARCGTIRYRQLQMDVGATVQGHLLQVEAAAPAGNVVELGADKIGAATERR
jgi:cytoskeletal protein CcmA (bactofilin family)